jgi:hypothetical protein
MNQFAAGPVYNAFWSDAAVGFQSVDIAIIAPGDLVEAIMVRSGADWDLTFKDISQDITMRVTVTYGAGAEFTQADWLQEDPPPENAAPRDLPYPALSRVHFTALRLDNYVPHLAPGNARTLMTPGGSWFVPTPVSHDGFALETPTGFGAQYLNDVAALDASINRFTFWLHSWPRVSAATRTADVKLLTAAYRSFNGTLVAQRWPLSARQAVALFVRQNVIVTEDCTAWSSSGYDTVTPQYAELVRAMSAPAAGLLRARLDVPPV